jgi:hypothetical protein
VTTFRHSPACVLVQQSHMTDERLFTIAFAEHARWLAENEIKYSVVGFRWPAIITILFSHDKRTIAVEFDLTIEDDTQAVMYRLFSGLTVSEVRFAEPT